MEPVWVTVIASIGSALIAGSIGLIAAVLSYRSSENARKAQVLEAQRNRKHSITIEVLKKRQAALEEIWLLIFRFETKGLIQNSDLELFIKHVVWCPEVLRSKSVRLLNLRMVEGSGAPLADEEKAIINDIRKEIISLAELPTAGNAQGI